MASTGGRSRWPGPEAGNWGRRARGWWCTLPDRVECNHANQCIPTDPEFSSPTGINICATAGNSDLNANVSYGDFLTSAAVSDTFVTAVDTLIRELVHVSQTSLPGGTSGQAFLLDYVVPAAANALGASNAFEQQAYTCEISVGEAPLRGLRDGPPPCTTPCASRAPSPATSPTSRLRRCYLSTGGLVPANHSPMISTRTAGSNLGNWTKAQSAAARRPEPAARAA